MSRRIFLDVEEALSREVRRITYHDDRTLDKTVLQETFDPFSGEIVQAPVEARYYDSSADTSNIQYPHFFIRLMKTREDRFSGRVVPQYGKWIKAPITTSPGAFEIIFSSSDAIISSPGNELTTSIYQIRKAQPGLLLRLLGGNNKGTYIIDSVTVNPSGAHTITVSNTLLQNLPAFNYSPVSGVIVFSNPLDLNTIKVGDELVDADNNTFTINSININQVSITIDSSATINSSEGAIIQRPGNIFQNTDLSPVRYLIMDGTKPVETGGVCGPYQATSKIAGFSPEIPLDAYYLIRIDSKTRENHIAILNRVWEEFNPPRTALPVIKRTALSAEQTLTADVATGGSAVIEVQSTSNFKVNDKVFVFDDFTPTKADSGEGFQRPFESKVVAILSETQIQLADIVPDSFKVASCAKIVSNAELMLYMFHFVDHVTKDVEGAQYWVHEFTFWVQIFVDRLETPSEESAITEIDGFATDGNISDIIIDC